VIDVPASASIALAVMPTVVPPTAPSTTAFATLSVSPGALGASGTGATSTWMVALVVAMSLLEVSREAAVTTRSYGPFALGGGRNVSPLT
jgi:hypothetical protein